MQRKYINFAAAMEMGGWASKRAVVAWVIRWNGRVGVTSEEMIRRRKGFVDGVALEAALEREAERHTAGLAARKRAERLRSRVVESGSGRATVHGGVRSGLD